MTVQQPALATRPDGTPDPFQVAATEASSLQEMRPRTLKHGNTFAVLDHRGDILSAPGSPEGLFHRDTRYLSHLELTLGRLHPMLLSSIVRDDNLTLTCDLTNPALALADGTPLEHDLLHVRRTMLLFGGTCFARLLVRNFSRGQVRLPLELRFAADFADLFEVRGTKRDRHGRMEAPQLAPDRDHVALAYTGLDAVRRTMTLYFDPPPSRLAPDRAEWDLDLPPDGRTLIYVEARCDAPPARPREGRHRFLGAVHDARRELRGLTAGSVTIETTSELFNETISRAFSDLYMLTTNTPEGVYPYAGIPWFSAPFGRDAEITALMTLWSDPSIARGVLSYLAAHQATGTDPAADAEPGKILHEVRHGEMAQLGEVPFRHYYGSVDSTPLFVMLAGAYLARTGDTGTIETLWPNVEAALCWMDTCGDRDGDGFVEYMRMTGQGLQNQGWKDSHDSMFHADGRLAEGPIALCEVQGYAYAAKRAAARMARRLGKEAQSATLKAQAKELRRRFEAAFWCEEIGTYAMALDGEKRPLAVRSSNAGHALLTGIAAPEHAEQVAATMLSSAGFSGWGVRTIASTEARYNPMSYHDGSVWPHDNALVALGMGRYGMRHAAARILEGLFAASLYQDMRRLPELFCGFPRRRGQGPTAYPVACIPQAWAAAAPIGALQACLGLGFDPAERTVSFDRPVLPRFLEGVVLRGLAIGGASLDVSLRRVDGEVGMAVLRRQGDIRAVMTS